ncbi:MAG: hypothetical protein HOP11_09585 [Saprospiraceae bacterium]|nr:hypothetical protein [Saprospiraceae bacterium]
MNKDNGRIILYGTLAVGSLFLGNKLLSTILESLGLKDSAEDKNLDDDIKKNYDASIDAFDPQYYIQAKAAGKRIVDIAPDIQNFVKKSIYSKCIGYVYDSPQVCLSAFKTNLKYKTQVSIVAHAFANAHGESMLGYISNGLDRTAQKKVLNEILEYVKNLPSGIN